MLHMYLPELSTGRMQPRFGSGRVMIMPDFVGRVTSDFKVFTDYFLVPESIWISEYCIRIDWFSTIFMYNNWIINK